MPCIKHNYKTVSNHYKDNIPNTESFSGEWRTEKICSVCKEVWEGNKFLEEKIQV